MKRLEIALFYFAILLITTGCSIARVPSPTGRIRSRTPLPATQQELALSIPGSPMMSKSPTAIWTAVSTPAIPSHWPSDTPSPAVLPTKPWIPRETATQPGLEAAKLSMKCLELKPIFPVDFETSGSLIFEDVKGSSGYGSLYQYDVKTGDVSILTKDASGFSSSVSTDREWLAYKEARQSNPEDAKLVIMNARGKKEKEILWQKHWDSIAEWLDNKRLWISLSGGYPWPLFLLNPFTYVHKTFSPDFPYIYKDPPPYLYLWGQFNVNETIYNPALTRVVYPERLGEKDSIVIWDMKKGKRIARINPNNFFSSKPAWSTNGKQFIINMDITTKSHSGNESYEELFSINQKGEAQRLTYLLNVFKQVSMGGIGWSPDQRSIAFLAFTDPDEHTKTYPETDRGNYPRLFIYNTISGEVTDYCIPTDIFQPPVWSPDSRQLVLRYKYGDDPPGKSHIYLVDLEGRYAVKIAEDMATVGWMKSP